MKAELTMNARQYSDMRKQLAKLDLPPAKRKRLVWRILKLGVMSAARGHQRRQEDENGRKWPGRSNGGRTKMMRHLPKMMAIRQLAGGDAGKVYLRRSGKRVPPGVVGAAHHTGIKTTMTAAKAKAKSADGGDRKATLRQAKALHDLGYTTHPVTNPVPASIGEIAETLSYRKAGAIIRSMRKQGKAKAAWKIETPARPWMALSDDEVNKMLARQVRGIGFGADIRAQDIKGRQKK